MSDRRIGTREEWQVADQQLVGQGKELAERSRKFAELWRELPWVPLEKEPISRTPIYG